MQPTTLSRLASILAVATVLLSPLPVSGHEGPPQTAASSPVLAATGTVSDLFVDNRLTGSTLRYIGLRLDDGRTFALAGVGLDALDSGARVDVTGSLAGKTFNVAWLTRSASQSTGQVRAATATPLTVVGALAIYHMDFFAEGRGEYGLAVRDDLGNITNLVVPAIPDSIAPNMRVSVEGTLAADGKSLEARTITILAPPPAQQAGSAETPITNTVLVIPIRYSNSPGDSSTGAQIKTEFETRVAPYFNEASYGQQLLNPTVACTTTVLPGCTGRKNANGWLMSPNIIPGTDPNATPPITVGNCSYSSMSSEAMNIASAAGYDTSISSTKFVYVLLGGNSGCGWAGLAYVGYGLAYSANVNALWVYGHELGHNFGLWHAGSTNCGAQIVGPGCGVSEYGDPFDLMGNIRQGHFNAMQKQRLNWIPGTSVKTHSAGTQTYQLSPIETGGQTTYAIKVPTTNANRTYWIEYRQPTGFDAFLSTLPNLGAQVRVATPFESVGGTDDTQVLDMTPGSGGGFDDSALLTTAPPYSDAQTGVTITVNSATAGANGLLSVTVAIRAISSTALGSSGNPSSYGNSVTITATVAGSAPTGTVAFTDGGVSISGCSAVSLPAGAADSKQVTCTPPTLGVGTHSIVATYSGDGVNNASISTPLAQVVNGAPVSLANPSFEAPALGAGYQYRPAGAGWTFTGNAGIQGNGSAWGGAAAPQGTQTAFIQKTGTIAQVLTLNSGRYVLTFKAAQRACCAAPFEHPITVTLDGAQIGPTITPPSTGFFSFAISFSVASSGSHTLAFAGIDSNGNSTFVDDVALVATNLAVSTIGLGTSANPAASGASVVLTATVNGSAPTGSVAFTDGGVAIGSCASVALPAGAANSKAATCTTSSLVSGTHDIIAAYGGDPANAASTSATLSQVVSPGSTLINAGFEAPAMGSSYQYTPSGGGVGWTFTAGAGIQGNGSAWGASPALQGTQTAFIQAAGTLSQAVSLNAGNYSVSFKAAQRPCCATPYTHPIRVSIDGVQIGANVTPASTAFSTLAINFTIAASGIHTLAFAGTDGTDRTTFIDDVSIGATPPSSIVNGGFESPAMGSSFQYAPAGAGWAFALGAGIQGNGSAWGATAAPEGTQTAFIQSIGTVTQTLTLNAGNYTLAFKAAQRACCSAPYDHPVKVLVDGVQVGATMTPSSTSFSNFSVAFTIGSTGAHSISIVGIDANDKATFIDAVTLN
ncbi:MAG: Ig-like domain repeat protein [Betaproteobacteria bacterium]